MNTTPIVIVHVRLASLNPAGTPAPVVHSCLEGYFVGPKAGDLVFIDAPYNITCVEEAEQYKQDVDGALGVLDRCAPSSIWWRMTDACQV